MALAEITRINRRQIWGVVCTIVLVIINPIILFSIVNPSFSTNSLLMTLVEKIIAVMPLVITLVLLIITYIWVMVLFHKATTYYLEYLQGAVDPVSLVVLAKETKHWATNDMLQSQVRRWFKKKQLSGTLDLVQKIFVPISRSGERSPRDCTGVDRTILQGHD